MHASLTWRTEVPLPIMGDRRAWDAVIRGRGFVVAVKAETRPLDVQAVSRRIALKRRDGGVDGVLLLVSDTRHNRSALAVSRETLRSDFPGDTRVILQRLGTAEDPGGGGIIVL